MELTVPCYDDDSTGQVNEVMPNLLMLGHDVSMPLYLIVSPTLDVCGWGTCPSQYMKTLQEFMYAGYEFSS